MVTNILSGHLFWFTPPLFQVVFGYLLFQYGNKFRLENHLKRLQERSCLVDSGAPCGQKQYEHHCLLWWRCWCTLCIFLKERVWAFLFQFLFLKKENTAVCWMRHVSVDIWRFITVIRWPLIRLPDYLFLYHLLNPDKFEFQISNLTMINI